VPGLLTLHFTSDDIARTRIAPRPDPLWELVLAVQMLRPQRGDLLFGKWRQDALSALRKANLGKPLHLLLGLTPNVGYFPDFLNPIEALQGLPSGLDAIRSTPKPILRRDIAELARWRDVPAGAARVAAGEPNALIQLTDTMLTCYRLIVAPYRRSIDLALDRDRSIRVTALANGGVEGLLRSFQPTATWSQGLLHVPTHRDQEIHLHGRGLTLIPSYFCVSGPLTLHDPEFPPVLIYPVERRPDALPGHAPATSAALRTLLGSTRATVLEAIAAGPLATSQLARRTDISLASASEHATVLRSAGLITSHRDAQRMVHNLTTLGAALLAHA